MREGRGMGRGDERRERDGKGVREGRGNLVKHKKGREILQILVETRLIVSSAYRNQVI